MNARRPATVVILTRVLRFLRLEFTENHLNWEMRDWESVLFTNKSRFHLSSCDRRVRVWRGPDEQYETRSIWGWLHYGLGLNMFSRTHGPQRV